MCVFAALTISTAGFAQDGAYSAYSPYTIFGVGDLYHQGTAQSKSMGGTGIASRDRHYINYVNPAAVATRDTLSFMTDISLMSSNKILRQGSIKSANNILNINNIVVSFPIYKKSAMLLGISPFSNVGYQFTRYETNPELIAETGAVRYSSYGDGSLYQLYAGYGGNITDRFSAGAQLLYLFGNIDKNTNLTLAGSSYRNMDMGYKLELHGIGGKFGLQYEHPFGDRKLTVGLTYRTPVALKGYVTDFTYASVSGMVDTVKHVVDTLSLASKPSIAPEIGIGFSFRKPGKWSMEVNYLRSDWSSSRMDKVAGFANKGAATFTATTSESIRAGFELIPNANDIRYYLKRCTYRGGAYYDKAYYRLDGNAVNAYGITFGMTLPVFRWHNGLSVGADIGRRGSARGAMVRETYAMFNIGFNIHDIWFVKRRYD